MKKSVKQILCLLTALAMVLAVLGAGTVKAANAGGAAGISDSRNAAAEWKEGTGYLKGDVVRYLNVNYICIQPHTALTGWEPSNVPALWEVYGGEVPDPLPTIAPTPAPTEEPVPTEAPEPTKAPEATESPAPTEGPVQPPSNLQDRLLIGYWHTWGGGPAGGVPFVKLRDVDPNWDVINISFAEPVTQGSTNGKMKLDISGLTADYTKDDFKQDIRDLQAQGKKIVLSIGGYEGYFYLTSEAAVNQFVSDIKGFVNEYGFDGIDIDLEQTSVEFSLGQDPDINNPVSPKIVNTISAIRQIMDSYDSEFILSWAPETFYVQMGYQFYGGTSQYCDSRAGDYLPMIQALRDRTTYVHVQLYNSIAITAPDGKTYSMGNTEATVAMCKMMLDGFTLGGKSNNVFSGLRPDQLVIGVPSSGGAAGSGHITNEALQQAFLQLEQSYPGIRGIMTWSINWDVFQNNNSFAASNGAFLDSIQ